MTGLASFCCCAIVIVTPKSGCRTSNIKSVLKIVIQWHVQNIKLLGSASWFLIRRGGSDVNQQFIYRAIISYFECGSVNAVAGCRIWPVSVISKNQFAASC